MLVSVFVAMGWNAAVPVSGAESGFTKQGPRRGGRADAMNGDALDAEGRLRMVISFQCRQHADRYGNRAINVRPIKASRANRSLC